MTEEPDDELADAETGETVTVERRQRHHSINSAPRVFYGSDRDVDAEIVAINRIETDDGFDDWEVVYRGEVTRTGPPYQASTDDAADSKSRAARLPSWAGIAIGTAVASVAGWIVLHGPASEIAQTPQPPLTGPGWGLLYIAWFGFIVVLVGVLLQNVPGMAGGR
jgi:hypothetical protein